MMPRVGIEVDFHQDSADAAWELADERVRGAATYVLLVIRVENLDAYHMVYADAL